MRFPRNVKIFRGGIDAAPFAGLFFVLVLLMILFYSHIFFPGVPIELDSESEHPEVGPRSVRILKSGSLQFLGAELSPEDLARELESRSQKGTLPRRIILEAERGSNPRLVEQIETTLTAAGIAIKLPGSRLDLPDDAGFPGAPNPVVVVSMNLNGQIFFEHQLVRAEALQERLTLVVNRANEPVTLLVQADKMVPYHKIIHLSQIARRAGIKRIQLATRPGLT